MRFIKIKKKLTDLTFYENFIESINLENSIIMLLI